MGYKTLSARDSNVNTGISQSKCNYRFEMFKLHDRWPLKSFSKFSYM